MNKNLIKKLSYLGLTTLGMQLLSTSVYALEQEPSTVTAQEQAEAKKQLEASVNPLSETEATIGTTEPATEATSEAEETSTETTSSEETPATGSTEEDTAEETTEAGETESTPDSTETEESENSSEETGAPTGRSEFGTWQRQETWNNVVYDVYYYFEWNSQVSKNLRYSRYVANSVSPGATTIKLGGNRKVSPGSSWDYDESGYDPISNVTYGGTAVKKIPLYLTSDFLHSLSSTNVVTIQSSGSLVTSIWGGTGNLTQAFRGNTKLKNVTLSGFSTAYVGAAFDPSYLFEGCTSLETVNLDGLQGASTAKGMFANCNSLRSVNIPSLVSLHIYSITDLSEMFLNCSSLTTVNGINNWNVSSVTSTRSMFEGCSQLQTLNLSNWQLNSATSTNWMFQQCNQLSSIGSTSSWTLSNVQNIEGMFANCPNLQSLDTGNWNLSNVTSTSYLFYNDSSLQQLNASSWNLSQATNMDNVFAGCNNLQTITGINNWNVSSVTSTRSMFEGCSQLQTLNLSNWQLNSVTNTSWMFQQCNQLSSIGSTSSWTLSNVQNIEGMFANCPNLQSLDTGNWNLSNVTNATYLFTSDSSLQQLNASSWNLSQVQNVSYLFYGCNNLQTITGTGNWDLSQATNMAYMFANCSKLQEIDVNHWNVSRVTDMNHMFAENYQLKKILNAGNWTLPQVQNMQEMFTRCSSLELLDTSNWTLSNVTNMKYTFYQCSKLTFLDLSNVSLPSSVDTLEMFKEYSPIQLYVITNDSTLLNYNYSNDSRVPPKIEIDPNGGTFSDHTTSIKNYFGNSCAIKPADATVSKVSSWISANQPTPPGHKDFDGWQITGTDVNTPGIQFPDLFGSKYVARFVGAFKIEQVPTSLSLNGTIGQSITSTSSSNLVKVKDTMDGQAGWQLTAKLDWQGDTLGDGTGYLQATPTGTITNDLGGSTGGVSANSSVDIKAGLGQEVLIMKADGTSGVTFDGVYSTDLGTIKLNTGSTPVAAKNYSWTIDWNLAVVP